MVAYSSSHERCASCGAALALDQRFCVECGQRRSGTSTPLFGGTAAVPAPVNPVAASRARRPLLSVNAALIAGTGTLLLAMGIGILIGRSSQGSGTKVPAVQLVTAPATTGATSGSTGGSEIPFAGTSRTEAGSRRPKSIGSNATSKPTPKNPRSEPKAVKLGSKGSGPGYQKGKFTGNFFGEEG